MKKTQKITLNALLAALAVSISAAEGLLPAFAFMPPGAKPGLSNIVTMYASKTLSVYNALVIVVLKAFFALFTRSATAFCMSLAGGVISTLVTAYLLNRKNGRLGCIGIGVLGAAAHNTAQIAVAALITNSGIFYYLPFLLIASIVTGSITGSILHLTFSFTEKRSTE